MGRAHHLGELGLQGLDLGSPYPGEHPGTQDPQDRRLLLGPDGAARGIVRAGQRPPGKDRWAAVEGQERFRGHRQDRKSTRLNSSHVAISYAVFCLKKKNKNKREHYKVIDTTVLV